MDSGFLSSSTPTPEAPPEVPKVPEQVLESAPVAASVPAPETIPVAPVEQMSQASVAVPSTVEQVVSEPSPESATVQEQVPVVVAAAQSTDQQLVAAPVAPTIATPPDKVAEDVQKILESGLDEALAPMPEDAKQRFMQKGKEIGALIADMVRQYKVEVKRVFTLLKDWLTSIPGVNRFFLEQEAKIKTDSILELERVRHEAVPA